MADVRIFIVEDDAITGLELEYQLKALGYSIAGSVSSGKEAIQLVGELKPDLVLMDIKLQGDMDGIKTAEQIRDHYDVPVVYLTAYAEDDVLHRAKITGPYGYLMKPFETRELRWAIEMALYKRQLDQKLRESENRFHTIYDHSPLPIWEENLSAVKSYLDHLRASGIKDFKTYLDNHPAEVSKLASLIKMVDTNQTALAFFKDYPFGTVILDELKEKLSTYIYDYLLLTSIEVFKAELVNYSNGGTSFEGDFPFRITDREYRTLRMKISIMPGYEDTFSRVLVSVIDITDQLKTADALRRAHNELEERVRERTAELSNTNETLRKEIAERIKAEEALWESEERFRTVADYAYDWEDWSGPNAELLFVSPSCERITGYTPEEFYRHVEADGLLNKIVHPDDKETWTQHVLHRTENLKITTIEFRIIRKDGEIRWIEHSCLPVYGKDGIWFGRRASNRDIGRRASNRDITDRKRAEAALQASEQTLRAVFNTIPESILVIDGSGKILHANETVIQRLGVGSSNQFIGANVFDILPPDTADERRQKVAELLQTRQPAYFEDSRLGKQMFNSIYPILDTNGEVEKIAIYALDITDRKLAEEQMHRLASQLITIQEDERLNIARDLHDEIGQAMAVLGFNLNALLAEDPPEQTSLQERIQDCIQILDTTTEHLRQIAYQLRPPALDTLPLSQSLQGLCLSFNRQTQLKINFSAEEKIPSLPDTFALSFYRLAQEGLTNVVKHAKASSVWVSLDYDQGLVSLQVEDDGQGFNPQITPPGIGLQGLRERFLMLRGSLDIESTPGKGTRLDGYLPWQP